MTNADPRNEMTELRIQLAEARCEAKLAHAVGELRPEMAELRTEMRTGFAEQGGRLEAVERSTAGIKPTVVPTGIAAVGLADLRGAVHAGVDEGAWITTASTVGIADSR